MKINEVLTRTTEHFKKKGLETARLDAEVLLANALKWQRIELYSKFDYPLSEEELTVCREAVRRRSEGEPVAYIVGQRGFYKHDFIVTPDVLIPRPETECLVERVLEVYGQRAPVAGDAEADAAESSTADSSSADFLELRFADFGTGSGCIGLSLLAELPGAKLVAVDLSVGALSVAKQNAEAIGVADRIEWVESSVADLNEEVAGQFDFIVANPPYVIRGDGRLSTETEKFEPSTALFSEKNGLEDIEQWSLKAKSFLKVEGRFYCEFGEGQADKIEPILQEQGWSEIKFHKDLSGITRFFEAKKG